jgi:NAD(P)-dependent dehydrogenase (short-subunit alcohol dehydrogenase family)
LSSQTVLITGALTGIGRATALAFATGGACVMASGRRPDVGEALVPELIAAGARDAAFFQADVRVETDITALVDNTTERFGRLDVAVNNAGTEGAVVPVIDESPESYATVFDTNVLGTLLSMKHELRAMQRQGNGNIVNISSIYGAKGYAGGSVYAASKHAIVGLTRSAALEGADHGVRVNAVAPGYIETAMFARVVGSEDGKAAAADTVPQRRAGHPEEVAAAIMFIAGDRASYLTGQTIFLDGGVTAG